MPKFSKKIDEIIKEYKSCFNCTNFKIKPFKINSDKSINISFKLNENKIRCTKNLIKNIDIISKNEIYQTKFTNPEDGLILQAVMRSPERYKEISSQCQEYDGE